MAEIRLTDLISIQTLQEIQDGFANLTGMAALTTDENGTPLTRGSNFTDFCTKLTRNSSEGCSRCEECDRHGGEQTQYTQKAVAYSCHAGLMDFAAPIMLNGQMIGSFIGGQVLTEEPDEQKFRDIANELDINPDKYIVALKKVKIVDKKQVDAAADFLCTIASVLSQSAYDYYSTQLNNTGLTTINNSICNKIVDAQKAIESTKKRINNLSNAFGNLNNIALESSKEVSNTAGTIKQIQNIAMNTKILGFNASIEASRAKEAGKGFGVIAQEVRSLAETSKTSADKIQSAMELINENTQSMNEQIKQTHNIIDNCLKDLERFNVLLSEIQSATEDND